MKVNVRYYGMVAEALGKSQEAVEFPAGGPVDLRAHFLARYPHLSALTWKVALGQELVEGPVLLVEGAEVVLLPPFAGG